MTIAYRWPETWTWPHAEPWSRTACPRAPDTGNIELLHLLATPEQHERWLVPLLDGRIRSCFAVKERKGAQHAPKHVVIVDALPLTALGKVDKKALRAPYSAGRDRGVA